MSGVAAQNTFFITAAAVLQKIISFVYFTILARALGVEDIGKYIFALTFTTIFSVLVDAGLSPALNREVARDHSRAETLLSNTLFIKLFLGALVYLLVVIAVNAGGYEGEVRTLVYLSGLTMLFDSLHLTYYAVLRGLQNLRFEAYGMVGSQLGTLILGSIALVFHLPLIAFIAAFTIPSFFNACAAGFLLKRTAHVRVIPHTIERAALTSLVRLAGAFAFAGIFARLYSYFDMVLLSKIMGTDAVGLYSVPNKIAFAFQFIPLALSAALFPAMSHAFVHEKEKIGYMFEQALTYMLLVALPIGIGLFVIAREIMFLVYGATFLPAVPALKVLMGSMLFAFLGFPVGAMLNACNKHTLQTIMLGITVCVNVAANILLIPRFGILGAAYAALIGNIVLTVGGILFLSAVTKLNGRSMIRSGILIVCAAALMGVGVYFGKQMMPWLLTIPLGALLYGACLVLFRVIRHEHWLLMRSLLQKRV